MRYLDYLCYLHCRTGDDNTPDNLKSVNKIHPVGKLPKRISFKMYLKRYVHLIYSVNAL